MFNKRMHQDAAEDISILKMFWGRTFILFLVFNHFKAECHLLWGGGIRTSVAQKHCDALHKKIQFFQIKIPPLQTPGHRPGIVYIRTRKCISGTRVSTFAICPNEIKGHYCLFLGQLLKLYFLTMIL